MSKEIFYSALSRIVENKELKSSGGKIGIPYPFKKLEYEMAGIQKGQVIGITANSGLGKSKFTRFIFLYNAIEFAIKNDYKLKIIYFPLEDSPERIINFWFVHYLYKKYNIRISDKDLLSRRKYEIHDNILKKIEAAEKDFTVFLSYVSFVKGASTPNEIKDVVLNYAKKIGDFYEKEVTENDITYNKKFYNNKTNEHVIVVIDNYSNLDPDKEDLNVYVATARFSRNIVRKIFSDICNFTVVPVLQQALAAEAQQYSNDGKLIINKLIPSMNNLGDVKIVARDCHIIYGIFSPERFQIESFPQGNNGHNINILGEYYRSFHIIKNNDGSSSGAIPLFFDGLTENIQELPSVRDNTLKQFYDYALEYKVKRIEE